MQQLLEELCGGVLQRETPQQCWWLKITQENHGNRVMKASSLTEVGRGVWFDVRPNVPAVNVGPWCSAVAGACLMEVAARGCVKSGGVSVAR